MVSQNVAAFIEEKIQERTPELLPVLKEVGVVDSGGKGLLYVYEGFLASLKGEKLSDKAAALPSLDDLVSAEHHKNAQSHMNTEDIEFGYCTEFMVKLDSGKRNFNEDAFRQDLSRFGDSLLVVSDENIAKVHIHAEYPGEVMTYAQKYGSLINMKISLDHPNIVSIYDVGEEDDIYYIVMEYVEGMTLKEYINRTGPLHPKEAVQIMEQIDVSLVDMREELRSGNRSMSTRKTATSSP